MKTLISQGSGDIYQLSHVFRANEQGPWHSCEFTMIEYYRIGMKYRDFMHEVADLVELFTGTLPRRILTYDEALNLIPTPDPDPSWDNDTALNFRFTHIEPHLGQDELTIITDYPLTQAALAKTTTTAQRFEIYYRGVELCNGYDELTDPAIYKERLIQQNTLRSEPLPLDNSFLDSLNMPPCCGVALGFDRLLALHTHSSTIHTPLK